MRSIATLITFFATLTSAHAVTPFNLDLSKVVSCKLKFGLQGNETLLTTIAGYDKNGKIIVQFGDENGNPLKKHEDTLRVKEHLIKSGICPSIESY